MKLRVDYFDSVNYAEILNSINMDVGQMAAIADSSVFAFLSYSSYVTEPISDILNIRWRLSGIIPSAKRYYAFMEMGRCFKGCVCFISKGKYDGFDWR